MVLGRKFVEIVVAATVFPQMGLLEIILQICHQARAEGSMSFPLN